jgi:penicillin-binding protein 2
MSQRSRLNLIVVQVLILSLMLAMLGRLFYLQVAAGLKYHNAALNIQSRDVVTPAIRGAIVDDNGLPLVMDRPGMVITVDRSALDKTPDKGTAVLHRVSTLIGVKYPDLYVRTRLCGELPIGKRAGCWNGTLYQPVPVTKDATEAQALKILENPDIFPGINATPVPTRSYPSLAGENAAHVLGYVGAVTSADLVNTSKQYYPNETVGKTGLEYQYDQFLQGVPGIKTVIVDRTEKITSTSTTTLPVAGNNLVTNINAELQAVTEKALAASVMSARAQGYKGDSGAAIVMDVHTGRILSMASYPTYDPNIWQKGLTVAQAQALFSEADGVPALSRAIDGTYAPASTFKALSVVAASHAGYNLNTNYSCPYSVKFGNQSFHNDDTKVQGNMSLKKAIAVSCDTIWYQIGYDQWVKDGGLFPRKNPNDYFFNIAKEFGVGRPTGIDLPSEASGRLPDRTWKLAYYKANKNFYCNYAKRAKPSDLTPFLIAIAKEDCTDGYVIRAGDAINFAIGQGDVLMTPLQLTVTYAAVANGGTLYKPEVARAIVKPDGTVVQDIKPVSNGIIPASASTLDFLHSALREVAVSGTASGVFANYPVQVSGKTGTGQVQGRNANGTAKDPTSWFASYAPSNKPEYAVVMMVSQGGYGAGTSAVGVKEIYNALFGVTGNTVDPKKSVFPSGKPPAGLPTIDVKNATAVKKP